jgi:hypothetical protein
MGKVQTEFFFNILSSKVNVWYAIRFFLSVNANIKGNTVNIVLSNSMGLSENFHIFKDSRYREYNTSKLSGWVQYF